MNDIIDILSERLTQRNLALRESEALLGRYQQELQSLGQALGCSDSQSPSQRLQEVLGQLGHYQKQVTETATKLVEAQNEIASLNQDVSRLYKSLETYQAKPLPVDEQPF